MPKCFAANYEPGPNWESGKPIAQQPLREHVAYLIDLHDKEVVLMGGPFADGTAGLVIVEQHLSYNRGHGSVQLLAAGDALA